MSTTNVCGDHGAYNDDTAECDCDSTWSGSNCTIPPPEGTACQPSDESFRTTYGGDLSCGNLGVYGTCQATGLCKCPTNTLGTRCQMACDVSTSSSIQCGGPDRGACNLQGFGECACVHGWTGNQCQTPPKTPCVRDGDCGWGGVNGVCEAMPDGTQHCACIAGYYGERCERKRGDPGAICDVTDDCTQPQCASDYFCSTEDTPCCPDENNCGQAKCVDNVCTVSGTTDAKCNEGGDDPSTIEAEIEGILDSLLTKEGISMMLVNKVTDVVLEKVVTSLVTAPYKAYMNAQIQKMVDSAMKKEITAMTEEIFLETSSTVIARAAAEGAAKETIDLAVDAAAEAVRGILGSVMDIVAAIGIVGMLLDASDVAGFSGQVNQDYLDLYQKKILEAYNTSDSAVEAGIHYPFEVPAYWDVPYQTKSLSDETSTNMMVYTMDYLAALQVNSEGDVIEFASDADQTKATDAVHNASTLNKILWTLSDDNEDVFQRWLQYWWVVLIVLVVALLLLVVPLSVYSAKVHKRAKAQRSVIAQTKAQAQYSAPAYTNYA